MKTYTYQDFANEGCARYSGFDNNRMASAILIAEKQGMILHRNEGFQEDGDYLVRSQTNSRKFYAVNITRGTCTCPDSHNGNICKHRLAVWLWVKMKCQLTADLNRKTVREIAKAWRLI